MAGLTDDFYSPDGQPIPLAQWTDRGLGAMGNYLQRPTPGLSQAFDIYHGLAPTTAADIEAEQARRAPYRSAFRFDQGGYANAVTGSLAAIPPAPNQRRYTDLNDNPVDFDPNVPQPPQRQPDTNAPAPVFEDPGVPRDQDIPLPTPQPPPPPGQAPAPTQTAPTGDQVPTAAAVPPPPPQDPLEAGRAAITGFEHRGATGDPYLAQNPQSGAYGAYQFLPSTYGDLVTRYGAANPWMPRSLDALKALPPDQQKVIQDRIYNDIWSKELTGGLQKGGHEVNPQNIALTNFLGPNGGPRFLSALRDNPGASADTAISPEALARNRNIFVDPATGRMRSVGEVYNLVSERAGGAPGGALRGAQAAPATAPAGTPQAAPTASPGAPSVGGDTDQYRAHMLRLLQQIEGERGKGQGWGDAMFRMGTGLLSARGPAGIANGGKLVLEGQQQARQEDARRDQTLVTGYGALSRQKVAADAAKHGAPVNLTYMRNGQPAQVAAEVHNGTYFVRDPSGTLKPAHEVIGNDFQITGRNDTDGRGTRTWNGIANALDETGGSRVNADGTVTPVFSWKNNAEREHFGRAGNMVGAAVQLRNMENSNYDPARVEAAIAQAVQNNPQGINLSTIIEQIGKATGTVTADDRIYATQLLRYMEGAGRLSSGAAITNQEWARFGSQFGGRANDPASVLQAIRMNRDAQAMGQAAAAGPAAPFLTDVMRGVHRMEPMIPLAGDSIQARPAAAPGALSTQAPAPTQQGAGDGSQQRPIKIEGPTDVTAMDPAKYYTSRGGVTKTGAEWRRLAGK